MSIITGQSMEGGHHHHHLKKKVDEINRSATFLVDELEKHPEYAQIIHRELHDVRLAGTNLALHPDDKIKNLPFIFERLQQIYFWSKDENFGLDFSLPELASANQMRSRHESIWSTRFLFEFEREMNITSDPHVICTWDPDCHLKIQGGLFYMDLVQAEKFYRTHSIVKDQPFIEPIHCHCHIDGCIWISTLFRYTWPIFSMKGCEGLVHCSKCDSFAHILCTYYLFLRKMVKFQTCVERSHDKFYLNPSSLAVFQFLQFCRKWLHFAHVLSIRW